VKQLYKIYFFAASFFLLAITAKSQLTINGTVYDSTKSIPVKGVVIQSTNGTATISDSAGHYAIVTTDKDSLTFIYQNKPTARFAVKQINDIGNFDISLHIRLSEKFRTLQEVRVYSRNFKQDSIENREQYAKLFNYQKPGITLTSDAYTGAAGMDLNELINVFRFKRNKQLKRMQERVLEQEKENYINYRFNKNTVRRVTRLDGQDLEIFMKEYRPGFDFTQGSTIIEFYQYILNASYQFKKELLMQSKKVQR